MCNADNLTTVVPEKSAQGHNYHSNSLQKIIGEIIRPETGNDLTLCIWRIGSLCR